MGRNKNKGGRNNKPKQPFSPPAAKEAPPTEETLEAARTETEFKEKRNKLLEQFRNERDQLEKERDSAKAEAEQAKERRNQLNSEIKDLEDEKKQLSADFDKLKRDLEKAQNKIEGADNKAKKLLEDAAKERQDKLAKADEEARKAWEKQEERLEERRAELAQLEVQLEKDRHKLTQDQQDLKIDQELLEEDKQYYQQCVDIYKTCSPIRLEMLQRELEDEKGRYGALLEQYKAVVGKLQEAQTLLDTFRVELEGSKDGRLPMTIKEMMEELHELKKQCEEYPDMASISQLELQAQKASELQRDKTDLERENEALQRECSNLKSEINAFNNLDNELRANKQVLDATKTLNEHLIQELEKNKRALESRTGDPCPALSDVDLRVGTPDFLTSIKARRSRPAIQSLEALVTHVKNFAGAGKGEQTPLYYSDNDIRAFLAGMAVSRLIILQGMSGTGKSSLPRAFSNAISGFNHLIPVESSWRDRNELLGYYNDFNQKFNAKSFTSALYQSGKELCRSIPTFIVLDEMNLARIEYYFSDFLAVLQKPDPSDWLIELSSADMRVLPMDLPDKIISKMKTDKDMFSIWERLNRERQEGTKETISEAEKRDLSAYLEKLNALTGAKDLIDGRKVRVTENIWFIGTANQDESTFEISDKVYDRAQVISLNRRGEQDKNCKYISDGARFISVEELQQLFDKAISSFKMSEQHKAVIGRLNALDNVLTEQFEVSFGNRIVDQSVNFAAVFVAAGGTLEDALDYQISTKILRKVLSSDDLEAFEALQAQTKDYPVVQKMIEKRKGNLL